MRYPSVLLGLSLLLLALVLLACQTVAPVKTTSVEDVYAVVDSSSCAAYSWKQRGRAPKAYMRGVALTYVKALCEPERSDLAVVTGPLESAYNDGLAHYGITDTSLKSIYTFMIGFGMRESSGKWCEGRDMSASNVTADTAEAGIYQTSYNSRVFSSELPKLFEKYRTNDQGCMFKVFADGVSCSASNLKHYGSGSGADFQDRSKECPAFAVEYAAVMLRKGRRHYGPITRREVEVKTECAEMLTAVDKLLSPALCSAVKDL